VGIAALRRFLHPVERPPHAPFAANERNERRHPMSMGEPVVPANGAAENDEESEEIGIYVEDGLVYVEGTEWEIALSPDEARDFAKALQDAAADAEAPEE
jgi:hypothetical protein